MKSNNFTRLESKSPTRLTNSPATIATQCQSHIYATVPIRFYKEKLQSYIHIPTFRRLKDWVTKIKTKISKTLIQPLIPLKIELIQQGKIRCLPEARCRGLLRMFRNASRGSSSPAHLLPEPPQQLSFSQLLRVTAPKAPEKFTNFGSKGFRKEYIYYTIASLGQIRG